MTGMNCLRILFEHKTNCILEHIFGVVKARRMTLVGHVVCTHEKKCSYSILLGNHKRKEIAWLTWHRWEDNINVDLKERSWFIVDSHFAFQLNVDLTVEA